MSDVLIDVTTAYLANHSAHAAASSVAGQCAIHTPCDAMLSQPALLLVCVCVCVPFISIAWPACNLIRSSLIRYSSFFLVFCRQTSPENPASDNQAVDDVAMVICLSKLFNFADNAIDLGNDATCKCCVATWWPSMTLNNVWRLFCLLKKLPRFMACTLKNYPRFTWPVALTEPYIARNLVCGYKMLENGRLQEDCIQFVVMVTVV